MMSAFGVSWINGRHHDDFSLDEFHAVVLLEDAYLAEAVVILYRETEGLRRREWTRHLLHGTSLPGPRRSTASGGFHGFGG
jgi:hypothetical protein